MNRMERERGMLIISSYIQHHVRSTVTKYSVQVHRDALASAHGTRANRSAGQGAGRDCEPSLACKSFSQLVRTQQLCAVIQQMAPTRSHCGGRSQAEIGEMAGSTKPLALHPCCYSRHGDRLLLTNNWCVSSNRDQDDTCWVWSMEHLYLVQPPSLINFSSTYSSSSIY